MFSLKKGGRIVALKNAGSAEPAANRGFAVVVVFFPKNLFVRFFGAGVVVVVALTIAAAEATCWKT